LVLECQIGTRF